MCPHWYLIQVDMYLTMEGNPEYISNNLLWCVFLVKHPDDNKVSNKLCRRWPDWYRYTRCPKLDDIIYGKQALIRSNDSLPLKGKRKYLL